MQGARYKEGCKLRVASEERKNYRNDGSRVTGKAALFYRNM